MEIENLLQIDDFNQYALLSGVEIENPLGNDSLSQYTLLLGE